MLSYAHLKLVTLKVRKCVYHLLYAVERFDLYTDDMLVFLEVVTIAVAVYCN